MYSVDTKLEKLKYFKYYGKYLYLYLNTVLTKVFAIVFVFGKFTVFVFVFKYYVCNVFGPKSDVDMQLHVCCIELVTDLYHKSILLKISGIIVFISQKLTY